MSTTLLCIALCIGPAFALKAAAPNQFSFSTFMLGSGFLSLLLSVLAFRYGFYFSIFMLMVLTIGVGVYMRPVGLAFFQHWNQTRLVHAMPIMRVCEEVTALGILGSALLSVPIWLAFAFNFNPELAALLPAFLLSVTNHFIYTEYQLTLASTLAGVIGFLLLVTYRLCEKHGGWRGRTIDTRPYNSNNHSYQ